MKQAHRKLFLIGACYGLALWHGDSSIAADHHRPGLGVLIDNGALVPAFTLERAERETANVFRQAGIEITWQECSFAEAEHRDPPGCKLPQDVPTVIVRILPEADVQRWSLPENSLGFSLDTNIYILFPRVQNVAEGQASPVSLVLGHVMAHEIGHCFLGAGHWPEGLMRAGFRRTDWERAAKGQLLFTQSSAHLLQQRVRQSKPAQALQEAHRP